MHTIFIDESGDLGTNLKKGSSNVFVVCMVMFDEFALLEIASNHIREFKSSIGKSDKYEIKFNKLNKSERLKLLSLIKHIPFKITYIVWCKPKNVFYRKVTYMYLVSKLIKSNLELIRSGIIYIDNLGYKQFLKDLKLNLKGIRDKYNVVFNLKFSDSKTNNLIQLVDVISGSIFKSYQVDRNDSQEYINIIERKVIKKISI